MTDYAADRELAKGFLDGDAKSVKQIDAHISTALYTWQRRLSAETDDVRSDVHLKLLISLQRNEFDYRSSLRTYITRILCHTCIDYLRLQNRWAVVDLEDLQLPDCSSNVQDRLEKKQFGKILFRVIRLIPAECRQLWRMYLKQGMSYREIGEVLGKSEGNIKRRLWACREAAKEIRRKILKNDKPF